MQVGNFEERGRNVARANEKTAHPCKVIHVDLRDGLTEQLDGTLSKRQHAAGIVRRSR